MMQHIIKHELSVTLAADNFRILLLSPGFQTEIRGSMSICQEDTHLPCQWWHQQQLHPSLGCSCDRGGGKPCADSNIGCKLCLQQRQRLGLNLR